jgi:hypothetical protein
VLIALTAWSVQWHVDLSIIRGGPIIESAYIPERGKKGEGEGGGGKDGGKKGSPTRSPVDVVQVAYAVLVRPVADFAVETWLAWAPSTWVLHDHGFAQVLVELEVMITPFHELCRLRKIFPLPFERLFACQMIDSRYPG